MRCGQTNNFPKAQNRQKAFNARYHTLTRLSQMPRGNLRRDFEGSGQEWGFHQPRKIMRSYLRQRRRLNETPQFVQEELLMRSKVTLPIQPTILAENTIKHRIEDIENGYSQQ
jgi:hypothetical protein